MTLEEIAEIDACLSVWRQGDVVLTSDWATVHVAHLAAAGTPYSEVLAVDVPEAERGLTVVAVDSVGFMVVTQTCDLIRSCVDRPFVEVCPLQTTPDSKASLVRAGRMTRYLWSPAIGDRLLVADLDRVSTLEKAALVRFGSQRIANAATDAQVRAIADALGRKRSRAALPEDFVDVLRPLQTRVVERHNKQTAEGKFLRAVREIRAHPTPEWAAATVSVELLFIFGTPAEVPPDGDDQTDALLKLVKPSGRFSSIDGRIATLDGLTAASYLASDRLDLEHLSAGKI